MKEMILLVLGFVLVNNYALSAYLGLTPMLGFAKRGEKLLALGLAVTAITVLSSLILWLLRGLIPAALQLLCAVTVILILVYVLQLLCGKKLGIWFPIIALSRIVNSVELTFPAAALTINGRRALYRFLAPPVSWVPTAFVLGIEFVFQVSGWYSAFRMYPAAASLLLSPPSMEPLFISANP